MLKYFSLRHLALPLASVALFASGAQAATVNTYGSLSSWTTAAGSPIVVEDFNDATLVPGLSVSSGSIGAGVFSGQAMPGVFPNSNRDGLIFSPGTTAFGANWDLSPGGAGAGIGFSLTFADTTTSDIFGISNPTGGIFNGFYGLVSDTVITSITFYTGSFTGNSELFNMDDARFVGQGGTVPEPGSLALLLAAGLGLVAVPTIKSRNKR